MELYPYVNERKEKLLVASAMAEACSAATQFIEMAGYAAIAFLIPIVLQQHQQLVVGAAVNFALIASALYVKGWHKLIPVILLPSIGAIIAGQLFGGLTPLLLMFAPVIWLGNAALVFGIKHFRFSEKWGYAKSVLCAVALKVALMGSVAGVLFMLNMVPQAFLYAMSVFQLITAVTASVVLFPLFKLRSGNV